MNARRSDGERPESTPVMSFLTQRPPRAGMREGGGELDVFDVRFAFQPKMPPSMTFTFW